MGMWAYTRHHEITLNLLRCDYSINRIGEYIGEYPHSEQRCPEIVMGELS